MTHQALRQNRPTKAKFIATVTMLFCQLPAVIAGLQLYYHPNATVPLFSNDRDVINRMLALCPITSGLILLHTFQSSCHCLFRVLGRQEAILR